MSTILGADGRPAEPTATSPDATKDDRRTMDVREVPMGILVYNLVRNTIGQQFNKMALEQMQHVMQQQKMVVDPPELVELKADAERQELLIMAVAGEINHRFKDTDARRLLDVEEAPVKL